MMSREFLQAVRAMWLQHVGRAQKGGADGVRMVDHRTPATLV